MPMLERYLHAIAFWLPEGQRRDIIAEIAEDLNAQIEDQETSLGRDLNEAELTAVLKRRGRPVLVANRYLPQQSLIGPLWFPAYLFVLKLAGLCYVLPWLIVSAVVYRVQHPGLPWGNTLLAAWGTLWTVAFAAAGVVTLVFVILQLVEQKTNFLESWDPRKLPRVRDPYKIPLSSAIAEVTIDVMFLLWWMAYASSGILFNGSGFKLSLAPVWTYFFWGFSAMMIANLVLAGLNLRSRSWSGSRAVFRLVLDLSGAVLFCCLLRVHLGATLYVANLSPAQTAFLRHAIYLWKDRCFPFAVLVAAIVVVVDLVRIVRLNRKDRVVFAKGMLA